MHFKKYLLIILILLPMEAFSIYDILSIDIKPTESNVQFCFNPNYPKARGNTYVVALMNNEILFISKNPNGFEVNPWQAEIEPPFYIASREKSSCLGPFPKAAMQGIQVYTGIGTSVGEMVENARFAKIFAGSFPTLPQPSKHLTSWFMMLV